LRFVDITPGMFVENHWYVGEDPVSHMIVLYIGPVPGRMPEWVNVLLTSRLVFGWFDKRSLRLPSHSSLLYPVSGFFGWISQAYEMPRGVIDLRLD